jgi:hypothetical protein
MTITVNSHNGFDPLKECWLGDCYQPAFFDYIENKKVRNVLKRISEETIEDLENIKEVMESNGVTVKRPQVHDFDTIHRISTYGRGELDSNLELINPSAPKHTDIPLRRPPMFPRDSQVIVGNTIYRMFPDKPSKSLSDCYTHLYNELDQNSIVDGLPLGSGNQGPNVIRLGNTIILDGLPPDTYRYFNKLLKSKGYKIITAFNEGHSDGMYNAIKDKIWISNGTPFNMELYFPDWETFFLPDAQWSDMSPFLQVKQKVDGKWWIPGEEHNDDLIDFVGVWFSEWVGFCEETVWDVNVLSLNPQTVLCLTENKELFKWLRDRNIEPIVTPFRHRFFWDGGLHCLTLDTIRESDLNSI